MVSGLPAEPAHFDVTLVYGHGIDEVRRTLARHGLSAEVRPSAPFMDPNEVLLKAAATILIVGPLKAFLDAFAAEAGKAAFAGLSDFLRDLRAARGDRVVLLHDRDSAVSVRIETSTPDEALIALFALDLRAFTPRHTLDWDADARAWVARKGRQRRSDVLGWFAPEGAIDMGTQWHLVVDPNTAPLVTLCGRSIERPQRVEGDHWQWAGLPCQECALRVPAEPLGTEARP